MIPTQELTEFPVFADSGTKIQPSDAKYSAGFQSADVLPAEWVNWLWNRSSSGVTGLNAGMASTEAELNAVVTAGGATPSADDNTQVITAINYLIAAAETRAKLAAHPVGSLYWSSNSTDPGTLFGGTWVQIKDKFVLAAGDSYTAGNTGGASSVTLAEGNLPSHRHTISIDKDTGSTSTAHTHNISHTHTRGTMNITGSVTLYNRDNWLLAASFADSSGCITLSNSASQAFSTGSSNHTSYSTLSINASDNWTGSTSDASTTTSGGMSANSSHSHSFSYSGNTGYTGSGTAFSIMPPYVVKYCFERTA